MSQRKVYKTSTSTVRQARHINTLFSDEEASEKSILLYQKIDLSPVDQKYIENMKEYFGKLDIQNTLKKIKAKTLQNERKIFHVFGDQKDNKKIKGLGLN